MNKHYNNNMFEMLFECSPDACLLIENNRFIKCNQAAVAMLRAASKEQILNTHPSAISPAIQPEGRSSFEKAEEMMANAVKYGSTHFEWMHKRMDGEDFPVDVSLTLIRDGERVIIYTVWRDISDRVKAENKTKEKDTHIRLLLKSMAEGIYGIDTRGICTFCNPSGLQLLGYDSEDELLGNEIHKLIHHTKADGSSYPSAMCRVLEAYRSTTKVHVDDELFWRRDGSSFNVEYWAHPIHEDGVIKGAVVTFIDITERKLSEEALRQSDATFRKLFEESSDAILLIDSSGVFVECNQAALDLLKMTREQFLYLPPTRISPEFQPNGRRSDEAALDMIAQAFSKGLHRFDWTCVNAEGGEFIVEVSLMPISIKGQTMLHTTWRDITERKRVEEEKAKLENQLLQSQKMESIGRLAGGVAHDFNNMLGVIIGHAELGLRRLDSAHPVCAKLKEIRKTAERSADLTRQLLAFARKQTIAPKVIDLNETVSGMLKMLQRLIGEDMQLVWRPANNLCTVKVDPSQMDQILANLCVNARDAIADIGQITIETRNSCIDDSYCAHNQDAVPGQYATLLVSDTGCGMDKETIAHIFEPFYTTKEIGKGTGLGLATVYGAVKQNNGFINVYSEPGKGTTFSIHLPCYAGEAASIRADYDAQTIPSGKETILLVEDETSILDVTATLLEEQGYTVLRAATPGEALQQVYKYDGSIHLLMTDVIMPGMNGRDLASNMRAVHPGIKQLFMSGYTADVIAHHGVLDDGVHFIQKPFSLQNMAVKVREVLDSN